MSSWTKEQQSAYMAARYAEQRRLFFAFLGGKCAMCGSIETLIIDHKDPSKKAFGVSKLWGRKRLGFVLDELRKCQLLCDLCNKKKTADDLSRISFERHKKLYSDGIHHGTTTGWMKKKCTCELCSANKWAWHDRRNAARRIPGSRGPYHRNTARVAE